MKDTDKNSFGLPSPRQSVDGFFRRQPSATKPVRVGGNRPLPQTGYQSYQPGRAEPNRRQEINRPRQVRRGSDTTLRASVPSRPKAAAEPERLANPVTRSDMSLPGGDFRSAKKSKAKVVRKWVFRSVTSVLVIILLIGGFLFSRGYLQLHRIFTGGANAAALDSDVNPSLLKGEGSGRVNILLLGIGGPGHDGSDLTDTIVIASIDVVNNKMALLSLPRDLWVKQPNNFIANYAKINAAYESGKYKYLGELSSSNSNIEAIKAGFKTADETISSVVGVPINYNVLVNFQAFQQAVNAVGGVTIDVPEEVYDPTMAWENHWNPVLAKAGVQQMDGAQALNYARSRETTSDFARSSRQRGLIVALRDKVLTAGTLSNPVKINDLLGALGDNVRSDISLSDMEELYKIVSGIPASSIKSVDLDKAPNNLVTTGNMNGQSIVEPKAGLFDYSEIQSFVRNQLRDGYLAKENALVQVFNGTDVSGLATDQTAVLKSYGYRVAEPGDTPGGTYQKTQIIDLTHGRDKYTLHYLERRYRVSATTTLPTGLLAPGANFVIILGQDEANSAN